MQRYDQNDTVTRYVEFKLEDGGTTIVEVRESETRATAKAGRDSGVPEKAVITFEQAVEHVRPVAEVVISRMRKLSDAPDQVGIEFGLKLSGTAGAIIASTSIEANFKITLTWKRE